MDVSRDLGVNFAHLQSVSEQKSLTTLVSCAFVLTRAAMANNSQSYIFPPGAGKCFLFTEVFFAKDRVPVGTRSVEKKTEVNK